MNFWYLYWLPSCQRGLKFADCISPKKGCPGYDTKRQLGLTFSPSFVVGSEREPFCSQSFCGMILAGEVGLLVARESLLLARKMV